MIGATVPDRVAPRPALLANTTSEDTREVLWSSTRSRQQQLQLRWGQQADMVTTTDLAAFQQQLRQEMADVIQELRTEVNERINGRMSSISAAIKDVSAKTSDSKPYRISDLMPRNWEGSKENGRSMKRHTCHFRDWCAYCMMGRGRTHHHTAKQKSEDQSRRPIIAMDYFFMKLESSPNAQEISEEPVTCIAVEEDKYQNVMSSVAMKKGVEEPWTVERVAKFIDLLGYREITLKSDTEPAIIAFRNRVAEACKAEVTTEDAVKGDKESNGLIENAVMLIRGIIRTIKCHIESRTQEPLSDNSPVMPWLVEHAGCILSRCQKGRDGKTPFERLRGKKPTQEFVPFKEKVLARRVTTEPMNRIEPQVLVRDMARNAKQQCRVLHWERRGRVQSQRNSKIGTSGQMGQRSHQQRDWSASENQRRKMYSRHARSSGGSHTNPSVAV